VRKAYHHHMPLSCNLGTVTSWNPLGQSRPVTGLLHRFLLLFQSNDGKTNAPFCCVYTHIVCSLQTCVFKKHDKLRHLASVHVCHEIYITQKGGITEPQILVINTKFSGENDCGTHKVEEIILSCIFSLVPVLRKKVFVLVIAIRNSCDGKSPVGQRNAIPVS